MSSESEILERVRRLAGGVRGSSRLRLGIGDDCAIYRPQSRHELLFTTDLLIENVHFRRETHTPRDIGYKALARGLSDLAAMGATPRFCLLSLAVPQWADGKYIDAIFQGLLKLAAETECPLAGGDLAVAPLLLCDIVACGSVPAGTALRRDGSRAGDSIWVSGRLGGSAFGLQNGRGPALRRHVRPEPRLRLGQYLRGKANAAMDLSDGLSLDLSRLCTASGLAAEIEAPPLFPGASLEQGLNGGEDYELLFTVPRGIKIPASFEGLALACIGRVVKGTPGEVRMNGEIVPPRGFDHFSNPGR
jgi:thiamine-monophosphate kinase